ncbi:MAG: YopX family protein [Treponema sp.]|jgi:uncharacterized phage protein (TIGR01671 family)|nr:YopX family protein [Treponema sp.]
MVKEKNKNGLGKKKLVMDRMADMREIEFRGKRKDNGEWVYGNLLIDVSNGDCTIIQCENYHIDVQNCKLIYRETVGQYTGLTDVKGTKIFEGDIVEHKYTGKPYRCRKEREMVIRGKIAFLNEMSGWAIVGNNSVLAYHIIAIQGWKIIGNIHDTPELLNRE